MSDESPEKPALDLRALFEWSWARHEAVYRRLAEDDGGGERGAGRSFSFELTLIGVDDLTAAVMDALFEAGCDDATPSRRDGKVYLAFDREARSRAEAMMSAYRDVRRAGFEAV